MVELLDSRRLTGPNLIWPGPGAVIDIGGLEADVRAVAASWRSHARHILDALGWEAEEVRARIFADGASLALSSPIDALYAATEVNEWAFEAARLEAKGQRPPSLPDAVERLSREIAEEANPQLLRLRDEASRRGVLFLSDPDYCSVGMGKGSRTFEISRIPEPHAIEWEEVRDVPLALVTGTNGKSTTVRVVAAMIRSDGLTPGFNTTDGVQVADEVLERGDYSGPEGARRVLRDRRVDAAVLEVARGGMLRRGLGVGRADAAAVLNVAEDHLGEFGVCSLADLVATKLVVRHAVAEGGHLILNLDDPALTDWQARHAARVDGFGRDAATASRLRRSALSDGIAAWLESETLVLRGDDARPHAVATVDEVPMTLGGAAPYNVSNALAALLLATRLGLSRAALRRGLLDFRSDAATNPGRINVFDLGGTRVLVDYAHNPHGMRALMDVAGRMGGARTLVLLGQAGDRDDDSIRELARIAWAARPDRIVIKEMATLLRGRSLGEIPGLLEGELRVQGAAPKAVRRAESEMEAVRAALLWARPGDLLLLPLHAQRAAVLELLEGLRQADWQPGGDLPA